MHIRKICSFLIGLYCVMGFSQEQQYDFTAFGYMPNVVSNHIFVGLHNSETKEIRFQYLDTIARIYLKSGYADSLMHYGKLIKNEAVYTTLKRDSTRAFELKGLYYEGQAAQKMGLVDEAIKSYIKGIEIADKDDFIQNYLKLQLAETYLQKGKLKKAEAFLEVLPQTKIPEDFYLKNAVVKSRFLILEGQFDFAKRIIDEVIAEEFTKTHKKLKLELQLNLSEIKLRQRNYKALVISSNTIKNEALKEGFYDVFIEGSIQQGFAYAMLKEYDIAEVALSSAYANTLQWNRLELQQRVINALVKLYYAKEDYKNAYSLITQYQTVSKTIADNQNQRLVKELEFKYETLKKEQEINALQEDQLVQEAEIDKQKTIKYAFLIGFLIILIPVILLLVVYYQKLQAQSLLNKQQDALNQQEVTALIQSQELDLAKNTIAVQSKERNRIARELHDSIGGNLAGIKLKMNSLGDHQPEFRQILNQLDATYDQVRDISHSLIPKEFEASAFTDLLKNYISNISTDSAANLRCETYPNEVINTIRLPLQVAFFNIIKELVTNALKHAKAKDITIQLTALSQEQSIELIYEDDGIGFDLKTMHQGIGLDNIESRVEEFNGTISINTAKNRGTVISISIPQT